MKRTALVRRTPLRAKRWGIGPSKKKRHTPLGDSRAAVFQQARGLCAVCGEPIRGEEWEDHHVFYRSHVALRVRHELWNRAPLHFPCHKLAHKMPAIRARLEAGALQRLYAYIGPEVVKGVLGWMPEGATDPSAFVRAYEWYRRTSR